MRSRAFYFERCKSLANKTKSSLSISSWSCDFTVFSADLLKFIWRNIVTDFKDSVENWLKFVGSNEYNPSTAKLNKSIFLVCCFGFPKSQSQSSYLLKSIYFDENGHLCFPFPIYAQFFFHFGLDIETDWIFGACHHRWLHVDLHSQHLFQGEEKSIECLRSLKCRWFTLRLKMFIHSFNFFCSSLLIHFGFDAVHDIRCARAVYWVCTFIKYGNVT